jgi:3-deoxy-D-manno-octulosonic acid kinase
MTRDIKEQYFFTARGGIVYDASRLSKPSEEIFDRAYWAARGALEERTGGRGQIAFLRTESDYWVLRHYLRGGWIANFSNDQYLWTGARRTRGFAEWRLLRELKERGLPVPAPIAARYVRHGLSYRADLITQELRGTRTVAATLAERHLAPPEWQAIGRTIARFHAQGVHHADLNANNILMGADGEIYLLDFDRGRIASRGAWEAAVLARLRRSFDKLTRLVPRFAFEESGWDALQNAYAEALGTSG